MSCKEYRGSKLRREFTITRLDYEILWVPILSAGQEAIFTINSIELDDKGKILNGNGTLIAYDVQFKFSTNDVQEQRMKKDSLHNGEVPLNVDLFSAANPDLKARFEGFYNSS